MSDHLFRAGRLFQEWVLNGWLTCDSQKCNWYRCNQGKLRADSYRNVRDYVNRKKQVHDKNPTDALYYNEQENAVGRIVLPSSHQQGPRWYNKMLQNAIAICRTFDKPTLFMTMTCNPHWPEILDQLLPGQTAQDRPDIVARVFKQKKDQFINDLTKGKIFGEVVGRLWVIEFQKRGLPHIHILIILAKEDIPKLAQEVDQMVCAELPPSPEEEGISEEEKARRTPLWNIVINNMIHGPCNPDHCMEKGVCSKGFPKPFQKKTVIDEERSYPIYQRRSPQDGGQTGKQTKKNKTRDIDNSWVVPYNPYLTKRYNCHINVEICISAKATKYLYKYVTKGPARAMVSADIGGEDRQDTRDEITDYEDLRCVGSCEACWHLYSFNMAENFPVVQVLRLHLENQQHVYFVAGDEENIMEKGRHTELTAFFAYNKKKLEMEKDRNPNTLPTYAEMPEKCVYRKNEWHDRERGFAIGRVHTVSPLAGDVFYLRIVLHHFHCKGKISFQDLMTVDGRLCGSYQEVCRELGLLSNDQEWHNVLTDMASTEFCNRIRDMYIMILIFCQPSNPKKLFDDLWENWTDDLKRNAERMGNTVSDNQLKTMVRLDLQVRLLSYEKDLHDFGLEPMTDEERSTVSWMDEDPLIRDEKQFDVTVLEADAKEAYEKFTASQHNIYELIMKAVKEKKSLQLFISARGGCGKTFLLNSVLKSVRSMVPGGCGALAIGTTGISAQLLHLGRTFHS